MDYKINRKEPDVIFRGGRPAAVILDIDEYREMLECLDDIEDLERLEGMKEGTPIFRKLEDFLEEYWTEREATIPQIEKDLRRLPSDRLAVVRDFVSFLLERQETARAFGTMLASESVLSRDWDSLEEDTAWDDL